jgi:hypothetical protein
VLDAERVFARETRGTQIAKLRMVQRTLVAGFGVLAFIVAACGGNVAGGSREDDGDAENPASQPDSPSGHGDGHPEADTELGECTLGPYVYETEGAPCAWLTDNRCYETRDMACNCACPRDRNSQCTSGFEAGPNGQVWVSCR